MRAVVFRPEAEADLLAITVVVAESSVARAKALVARLRARCNRLVRHPLLGRPRPELGEGLRSLVERPYVIVYRVADDRAEIVAVLHGRRDLPSALAARIVGERD